MGAMANIDGIRNGAAISENNFEIHSWQDMPSGIYVTQLGKKKGNPLDPSVSPLDVRAKPGSSYSKKMSKHLTTSFQQNNILKNKLSNKL